MTYFYNIPEIVDCIEFIDDHLSSLNFDALYEYCCSKYGGVCTGVAAYSLLVLRLSKYEKV